MQIYEFVVHFSIFGILTMLRIKPSFENYFVGKHSYKDFISFVTSSGRCGFIPWQFSSNIYEGPPDFLKTGDSCLIFMTTMQHYDVKSQISIAHVTYFTFGRQYNYEIKPHPCTLDLDLQNVELMLICHGKTDKGTICDKNETCVSRGEICQRHLESGHDFCISKRYLYESCDEYSSCQKNSGCKLSDRSKPCINDFEHIDGRCLKGCLKLNENCTFARQCSGTRHASQCLYDKEADSKICSCMKGFISNGTSCIIVKGEIPWLTEKENQLLLIAIGGYFGMLVCLLATLLSALKRGRPNTNRLKSSSSSQLPVRDIQCPTADDGDFISRIQAPGENVLDVTQDQSEHIYDEARHSANQETVNVYNYTEPLCYCSDKDTYNHLHEKPSLVSDGMYGLPETVSISLSTPMQDNEL